MTKPDEKTLAALNVRIATMSGWREVPDKYYTDRRAWVLDTRRYGTCDLPDFTGSLDAIHEAESKLLTGGYATQYNTELRRIFASQSWLWHAEAWQRAIALDRTLSPSPIL